MNELVGDELDGGLGLQLAQRNYDVGTSRIGGGGVTSSLGGGVTSPLGGGVATRPLGDVVTSLVQHEPQLRLVSEVVPGGQSAALVP